MRSCVSRQQSKTNGLTMQLAIFLENALRAENSAQFRQLTDCCLHNTGKTGAFS
jgi:hypothetical protein